MKKIKTEDAVGIAICHDMTRIIPGVMKDATFRRGHIIETEDVPILLSMGKTHIYVWEDDENLYHEDQAAEMLSNLCRGKHTYSGEVKEGKIQIYAHANGVVDVDKEGIDAINNMGDMMIATLRDGYPVSKGQKLAGTRIIPLTIDREKMDDAVKLIGERKLINVRPFAKKKVGLVITGDEVKMGLIEDKFAPVVEAKLKKYQCDIIGETMTGDLDYNIVKGIEDHIRRGADFVICTGGMSVDPDDMTPSSIEKVCEEMYFYGAPVLPGAMFALGYTKRGKKMIPVVGLPGGAIYSPQTIFDRLLPKIMADVNIEKKEVKQMGVGGFCMSCERCHFPNCSFGG